MRRGRFVQASLASIAALMGSGLDAAVRWDRVLSIGSPHDGSVRRVEARDMAARRPPLDIMRALEGWYSNGTDVIELAVEHADIGPLPRSAFDLDHRLVGYAAGWLGEFVLAEPEGWRIETQFGALPVTRFDGRGIVIGGDLFAPMGMSVVPPVPTEDVAAAIGAYGGSDEPWILYETGGRLAALTTTNEAVALRQIGRDRYRASSFGPSNGVLLRIERSARGAATALVVAGQRFARNAPFSRHDVRIARGAEFDAIEAASMQAVPPVPTIDERVPELVDLRRIAGLRVEQVYATQDSVFGRPLYEVNRPLLQRDVACALERANASLRPYGVAIVVFDSYRPWRVTKVIHDALSEELDGFAADARIGSVHNRGAAVDVGLYDLRTGSLWPMVSGYDEPTSRASPYYRGGTMRERWGRSQLRRAMEREQFYVIRNEWWHFDHLSWPWYAVLNAPLRTAPAVEGLPCEPS